MKDAWELKVATEVDVDPAVEELSDHMNDRQRAAFKDKLQRYVRKPGRELIVAVHGGQTLGLVCVIEQAQFPPPFPRTENEPSTKLRLRHAAPGTSFFPQARCWWQSSSSRPTLGPRARIDGILDRNPPPG